jgi:hypothetical protein
LSIFSPSFLYFLFGSTLIAVLELCMGFWLALYTMLCLCVTKFPLKIVNDFKGVYLIVRFFYFIFLSL